jgi:hypothetical protein
MTTTIGEQNEYGDFYFRVLFRMDCTSDMRELREHLQRHGGTVEQHDDEHVSLRISPSELAPDWE